LSKDDFAVEFVQEAIREREEQDRQERLARQEQERLVRQEQERQERLEQERLAHQARQARQEQERLARQEQERQERLEQERLARQARQEQERLARQEQERLEQERLEEERLEREYQKERTRIKPSYSDFTAEPEDDSDREFEIVTPPTRTTSTKSRVQEQVPTPPTQSISSASAPSQPTSSTPAPPTTGYKALPLLDRIDQFESRSHEDLFRSYANGELSNIEVLLTNLIYSDYFSFVKKPKTEKDTIFKESGGALDIYSSFKLFLSTLFGSTVRSQISKIFDSETATRFVDDVLTIELLALCESKFQRESVDFGASIFNLLDCQDLHKIFKIVESFPYDDYASDPQLPAELTTLMVFLQTIQRAKSTEYIKRACERNLIFPILDTQDTDSTFSDHLTTYMNAQSVPVRVQELILAFMSDAERRGIDLHRFTFEFTLPLIASRLNKHPQGYQEENVYSNKLAQAKQSIKDWASFVRLGFDIALLNPSFAVSKDKLRTSQFVYTLSTDKKSILKTPYNTTYSSLNGTQTTYGKSEVLPKDKYEYEVGFDFYKTLYTSDYNDFIGVDDKVSYLDRYCKALKIYQHLVRFSTSLSLSAKEQIGSTIKPNLWSPQKDNPIDTKLHTVLYIDSFKKINGSPRIGAVSLDDKKLRAFAVNEVLDIKREVVGAPEALQLERIFEDTQENADIFGTPLIKAIREQAPSKKAPPPPTSPIESFASEPTLTDTPRPTYRSELFQDEVLDKPARQAGTMRTLRQALQALTKPTPPLTEPTPQLISQGIEALASSLYSSLAQPHLRDTLALIERIRNKPFKLTIGFPFNLDDTPTQHDGIIVELSNSTASTDEIYFLRHYSKGLGLVVYNRRAKTTSVRSASERSAKPSVFLQKRLVTEAQNQKFFDILNLYNDFVSDLYEWLKYSLLNDVYIAHDFGFRTKDPKWTQIVLEALEPNSQKLGLLPKDEHNKMLFEALTDSQKLDPRSKILLSKYLKTSASQASLTPEQVEVLETVIQPQVVQPEPMVEPAQPIVPDVVVSDIKSLTIAELRAECAEAVDSLNALFEFYGEDYLATDTTLNYIATDPFWSKFFFYPQPISYMNMDVLFSRLYSLRNLDTIEKSVQARFLNQTAVENYNYTQELKILNWAVRGVNALSPQNTQFELDVSDASQPPKVNKIEAKSPAPITPDPSPAPKRSKRTKKVDVEPTPEHAFRERVFNAMSEAEINTLLETAPTAPNITLEDNEENRIFIKCLNILARRVGFVYPGRAEPFTLSSLGGLRYFLYKTRTNDAYLRIIFPNENLNFIINNLMYVEVGGPSGEIERHSTHRLINAFKIKLWLEANGIPITDINSESGPIIDVVQPTNIRELDFTRTKYSNRLSSYQQSPLLSAGDLAKIQSLADKVKAIMTSGNPLKEQEAKRLMDATLLAMYKEKVFQESPAVLKKFVSFMNKPDTLSLNYWEPTATKSKRPMGPEQIRLYIQYWRDGWIGTSFFGLTLSRLDEAYRADREKQARYYGPFTKTQTPRVLEWHSGYLATLLKYFDALDAELGYRLGTLSDTFADFDGRSVTELHFKVRFGDDSKSFWTVDDARKLITDALANYKTAPNLP